MWSEKCTSSVKILCVFAVWTSEVRLYRRILRTWALRWLILLQFLPKAILWMMNNRMTKKKKKYPDMFIIYWKNNGWNWRWLRTLICNINGFVGTLLRRTVLDIPVSCWWTSCLLQLSGAQLLCFPLSDQCCWCPPASMFFDKVQRRAVNELKAGLLTAKCKNKFHNKLHFHCCLMSPN